MLDKLSSIYERYVEIEKQMNDPSLMSDIKNYIKLSKDYKDLQPIVAAYKTYKNITENITMNMTMNMTISLIRDNP